MTADNDKPAAELVDDLKEADAETAQAILDAERQREVPRVTVVRAGEARLAELAPALALPDSAEVLEDGEPVGPWAQLLDGSGEPVLVDGNPVAVPQET